MTPRQRPLGSKKFLNLLLAVFVWTGLIALGSLTQVHYIPLTAMIVTLGFVQVMHLFGQSAVDIYATRLASIVTAPVQAGSAAATGAVERIGDILDGWTAPDKDDPETPGVLLED
jgi:hypothetical protein